MSDIQGVSGTDTEKSAAGANTPAGVTPPGAAGGRSGFLSDVIVELGFASQATVEQAVRAARSPGTTVARVLLDMNAISEEQLARATAERYGIDYIELEGFQVDAAAANLIKPAAAQRYHAVPVAFLGQVLLVAMGDPADAVGVNDIAAMTARTVRPAVASRPALDALLRALPLDESQAPPPVVVQDPLPRAPESPPAPAEAGAADTTGLREELNTLKSQFAGVQAKLQGSEPEAQAEPGDVAALQAKLAEAEAELEAARARVREAKEVSAEVETLREALTAAEAGLVAREQDTPDSGRVQAREHARQVESELRRIRADVDLRSGQLEDVRNRLTQAETELVRVRAELDTRGSQLEAMRTRAESAEAEADSALRRVVQAESESDEARRDAAHARQLAAALEGTDERAEGARKALAELREENERERELSAVSERDLRATLREEEARRAELEQRLAEVEGSAFAAERAFEELRLAQGQMRGALRALADPEADEPDG